MRQKYRKPTKNIQLIFYYIFLTFFLFATIPDKTGTFICKYSNDFAEPMCVPTFFFSKKAGSPYYVIIITCKHSLSVVLTKWPKLKCSESSQGLTQNTKIRRRIKRQPIKRTWLCLMRCLLKKKQALTDFSIKECLNFTWITTMY